jgi:hypothetical protein
MDGSTDEVFKQNFIFKLMLTKLLLLLIFFFFSKETIGKALHQKQTFIGLDISIK